MRRYGSLSLGVAAALAAVGCSSAMQSAAPLARVAGGISPAAAGPPATWPLDRVAPAGPLPEATTRPAGRPSAEALASYALGQDRIAAGHPLSAVVPLNRAIALDPYRYDPRAALGRAYAATGGSEDPSAIAALERAVALDPDHVEAWTELGRLYLAKGDAATAIARLRTAMACGGYAADSGRAAAVDFYLAKALALGGYDRAALAEYGALLGRFKDPAMTIRETPELVYAAEHPEQLFVQIGALYERHEQWAEALSAYRPAAEHDPADVAAQARVARVQAMLGRRGDRAAGRAAIDRAADLVVRERASPASLDVVRDVCQRLGLADGVVATLRRVVDRHPADVTVRFALADLLQAQGRDGEARDLIEQGWRRTPGDVRLTVALAEAERRQGTPPAEVAAQVVCASARNPDAAANLAAVWDRLIRPGATGRLTPVDVAALHVGSVLDEPARLLWLAHTYDATGRTASGTAAVFRAVRLRPAYPPAFRAAVAAVWADVGTTEATKVGQCDALAAAADAGDASLAAEVRGRSLMARHRPIDAAARFAEAVRLGGRSPALLLAAADAAHPAGTRDPDYERALWHVADADPLYPPAYLTLFDYYADPSVAQPDQAARAIRTWAAADPRSSAARAARARIDAQLDRSAEAERAVDDLLATDPADPDVAAAARAVYVRAGKAAVLVDRLEAYRQKHPAETAVAAQLAGLYADAKRNAEAGRVLDAARAAAADDPDLLYPLAGAYATLGDRRTAEDVLRQVVALDPTGPAACNDLGFAYADRGENLPEAERMIRTAVAADPDNRAYLDSLGWVLYKRGTFDASAKTLADAVGPPDPNRPDAGDPAVLDHLGDALYRLNRPADAVHTWQRALASMEAAGEVPGLRLQVQQKLREATASKPVGVAPVATAVR